MNEQQKFVQMLERAMRVYLKGEKLQNQAKSIMYQAVNLLLQREKRRANHRLSVRRR